MGADVPFGRVTSFFTTLNPHVRGRRPIAVEAPGEGRGEVMAGVA